MVITFEDAEDRFVSSRLIRSSSPDFDRSSSAMSCCICPSGWLPFEAATERKLEELDRRVGEKASQSEMDRRFDAVDQRFDEIEQRVDTSTALLSGQIADLRRTVHQSGGRAANRDGIALEASYRANFSNWFGEAIDDARLVGVGQLERLRDARKSGLISIAEWRDVMALDFRAIGTDPESGGEIVLAVEVSVEIQIHDARRATARAAILSRVGYNVSAAVGGYGIDPEAQRLAQEQNVVVDLHRPPE
jgi:hypothetical protein